MIAAHKGAGQLLVVLTVIATHKGADTVLSTRLDEGGERLSRKAPPLAVAVPLPNECKPLQAREDRVDVGAWLPSDAGRAFFGLPSDAGRA